MAVEAAVEFAKGIYIAHAAGLHVAYPYCDRRLQRWVSRELPPEKRVLGHRNKILVRNHIATRFKALPYVTTLKGSFRFDLAGLAATRFEQVLAFADQAESFVPGAARWLQNNRRHLGNKFDASRFYLLAVVLPWMLAHGMLPRREKRLWRNK